MSKHNLLYKSTIACNLVASIANGNRKTAKTIHKNCYKMHSVYLFRVFTSSQQQ